MKPIYFYLFPLFPFPCVLFFIFEFSSPLLVWENIFKGIGYGTRELKDGSSRHPEKVYPGGEGHERGGRGEGRGQLRQRLYGESELTGVYTLSLLSYIDLTS